MPLSSHLDLTPQVMAAESAVVGEGQGRPQEEGRV